MVLTFLDIPLRTYSSWCFPFGHKSSGLPVVVSMHPIALNLCAYQPSCRLSGSSRTETRMASHYATVPCSWNILCERVTEDGRVLSAIRLAPGKWPVEVVPGFCIVPNTPASEYPTTSCHVGCLLFWTSLYPYHMSVWLPLVRLYWLSYSSVVLTVLRHSTLTLYMLT